MGAERGKSLDWGCRVILRASADGTEGGDYCSARGEEPGMGFS